MHWIKRTLKLASIDPWYLVRGYPNGPRQSSRAVKRARAYLESVGILPLLISGDGRELPPDFPDLAFLHRAVSRRKPRCILEFGCGFSTIVMASALSGGELYAVDSSQQWIENTRAKLGAMPNVHVSYSPVKVGAFNGQLCSFYERLPDVVPDFVFLDGPDPAMVEGQINGLSFQNPVRTVMAGDLLLMESTLLPGFYMVVDGRTNNARFLARNLQRPYAIRWRRTLDLTTFEMREKKLGYRNVFGYE